MAWKVNVPVVLSRTFQGPADPETSGNVLKFMIVPMHPLPPNRLNVTVPVGLEPPVTVAVSDTDWLTTAVLLDSVVVIVGVGFANDTVMLNLLWKVNWKNTKKLFVS